MEEGVTEGLLEGIVLERVTEEGININEGLEERGVKSGEERVVTEDVAEGVAVA